MTMSGKSYPRTPDDAKREGVGHYDPQRPCLYGHWAMRRVSDDECVRCAHIKDRAKYKGNE